MMFEVYDKRKPVGTQLTVVYDIRNDQNGYPSFLIYDKGQWLWQSAKHFKPTRYNR